MGSLSLRGAQGRGTISGHLCSSRFAYGNVERGLDTYLLSDRARAGAAGQTGLPTVLPRGHRSKPPG